MAKRTQSSRASHDKRPWKGRKNTPGNSRDRPGDLRIVGGKFRGRKLRYQPFCVEENLVTRPMKDRVREAIFNLVGLEVKGRYAIDLFAGTGALGLEAISRGAVGATFIEKHVPTARVVEANITSLEVQSIAELKTTSAFLWTKRDMSNADFGMRNTELDQPSETLHSWIVFCSPPYAFYDERQDDMLELITAVTERAPEGSLVDVEADDRFDFNLLPGGPVGEKRTDRWQVRTYSPAVVGVWRS
jgi:16S rRNA (guanine966-N2)-methyltransferase